MLPRICYLCQNIYWAEGGETPCWGCQSIMVSWWYLQSLVHQCACQEDKSTTCTEKEQRQGTDSVFPSWVQDDSSKIKGQKCVTAFLTSPLLLTTIIFQHCFTLYLLCYLKCSKVCVFPVCVQGIRRLKSNTPAQKYMWAMYSPVPWPLLIAWPRFKKVSCT